MTLARENLKFSEKNLTQFPSTKANPTWTGLELNSSLLDEKSEQKYEFSLIRALLKLDI
jgi:hypothetical protein